MIPASASACFAWLEGAARALNPFFNAVAAIAVSKPFAVTSASEAEASAKDTLDALAIGNI